MTYYERTSILDHLPSHSTITTLSDYVPHFAPPKPTATIRLLYVLAPHLFIYLCLKRNFPYDVGLPHWFLSRQYVLALPDPLAPRCCLRVRRQTTRLGFTSVASYTCFSSSLRRKMYRSQSRTKMMSVIRNSHIRTWDVPYPGCDT